MQLLKNVKFFKKLTKRQQLSLLVIVIFVLILGGASLRGLLRSKMKADTDSNNITNQATLTYTNSQGQIQTVLSNVTNITKNVIDTTPPSDPYINTIIKPDCTDIAEVNWTASTDNVAVNKYLIYRNGLKIAEVQANELSFSDRFIGMVGRAVYPTQQVPSSFLYGIQAVDAAGNTSAVSQLTQALSFPSSCSSPFVIGNTLIGQKAFIGLKITENSNNYNISWTSASLNRGQVSYGDGSLDTVFGGISGNVSNVESSATTNHSITVTSSTGRFDFVIFTQGAEPENPTINLSWPVIYSYDTSKTTNKLGRLIIYMGQLATISPDYPAPGYSLLKDYYLISGAVTDRKNKKPIPQVIVSILDRNKKIITTRTNSKGEYTLAMNFEANKIYRLMAEKTDYLTTTSNFKGKKENLMLDISLNPRPILKRILPYTIPTPAKVD